MGTSSLMPTYPAAVIVGHIALTDAQPGSSWGSPDQFSGVAGHPQRPCVEPRPSGNASHGMQLSAEEAFASVNLHSVEGRLVILSIGLSYLIELTAHRCTPCSHPTSVCDVILLC